MSSVIDFYLSLRGRDNWVTCFIEALKKCGHGELAEEFEGVYSSHQLPTRRGSSPQSLPPSLNHNNRQPPLDNPEHRPSLPGQMLSASLDTQPGSSQRTLLRAYFLRYGL
ncbi:hypothetical protein GDO78_019681 [Eleutherodactylus coqui]|uniref:Uncharacterized protein n=1 Tax=Eleutherodactylus coqui TaxID=57060 RepID=A0A8J6EIB7_ELECQ|nr:hypothetical protein GDO78_019681 [Eleutherodactylus coqui]